MRLLSWIIWVCWEHKKVWAVIFPDLALAWLVVPKNLLSYYHPTKLLSGWWDCSYCNVVGLHLEICTLYCYFTEEDASSFCLLYNLQISKPGFLISHCLYLISLLLLLRDESKTLGNFNLYCINYVFDASIPISPSVLMFSLLSSRLNDLDPVLYCCILNSI